MRYADEPCESEAADFIIEWARSAEPDRPLFVLGLGAASNLASALLLHPDIMRNVVYMFHGRSEETWPVRTTQFNIYGDILAAKTLLESDVPLIWFDTGTKLCVSMCETERRLAPLGPLGKYLHEYRLRADYFQRDDKGFFDLGDIAWLIDSSLCRTGVVDAPTLTRWMYFDHSHTYGKMLYVSDIDVERTWSVFFEALERGSN